MIWFIFGYLKVPSQVSHQDFWRRYFYKLHQLEVDEARKQALMKRAERANVKEDSVGWDEGNFVVCFCPSFEINPLQEDKILDWSKLKQIADNILKCI